MALTASAFGPSRARDASGGLTSTLNTFASRARNPEAADASGDNLTGLLSLLGSGARTAAPVVSAAIPRPGPSTGTEQRAGGSPSTFAPHRGSQAGSFIGAANTLTGGAAFTPAQAGIASLFSQGTPGGNAGLRQIASTALSFVPVVGPLLGLAAQLLIPNDENPYAGKSERLETAGTVYGSVKDALGRGDLNAMLPGSQVRVGDFLASLMAQNQSGAYSGHPWGWDPNPGFQGGLAKLTEAGYNPNTPFDKGKIGSLGELIAASSPIDIPQPYVGVKTWEDLLRGVTQGLTGSGIGRSQRVPTQSFGGAVASDPAFAGTAVTGLPSTGWVPQDHPEYLSLAGVLPEFWQSSPGALAALNFSGENFPGSIENPDAQRYLNSWRQAYYGSGPMGNIDVQSGSA